MNARRQELRARLERYYRDCGWHVEGASDGSVRARGPGGVTWIGLPVVPEDLDSPGFDARLRELSDERMPAGELCPLDLLPAEECAEELHSVLRRLRLSERGHVEVYSLAA